MLRIAGPPTSYGIRSGSGRGRVEVDRGSLDRRGVDPLADLLHEVVNREKLRLARHPDLSEQGPDDRSELLECLRGFPDVDDAPAVIGWTGDVRQEPLDRPVGGRM